MARLEQRILATAVPGSVVDRDEVQLRLDVLANCVGLFQSGIGEIEELVQSDPEFRETIAQLANAVDAAQQLIPGFDNPEVAKQMLELFSPLDAKLARLASSANSRSGERIAVDQQHISQLHWIFSTLVAAMLLCSLFLIGLLLWNNRLLQRMHQQVLALAETAEKANRIKGASPF